jgi:ABC-2 type transport system permease protein
MVLELIRQAKRRRTLVALLLSVVIPLVIVGALKVNQGSASDSGGQTNFVDIASRSGLNAAFFVLVASSQFLLVVLVALFAGDSIASEASWGSLRYLLTRPIPRMRLLRVKLSVAVLFGLIAAVLIPAIALIAGTLAFGWKPVTTPFGGGFGPGSGLLRLAGVDLYVMAMLGCVVSLAFLFSTMTDAPLAAVGGATILIVISQVLDQVTALGAVRDALPTHYWFDWTGLLQSPPSTGPLTTGLLTAVPWTAAPLLLAFWNFRRKDILS